MTPLVICGGKAQQALPRLWCQRVLLLQMGSLGRAEWLFHSDIAYCYSDAPWVV